MYIIAHWYYNKELEWSKVPDEECVGLQSGQTVLLRRITSMKLELAFVYGVGDTLLEAKKAAGDFVLRTKRMRPSCLYKGRMECIGNLACSLPRD